MLSTIMISKGKKQLEKCVSKPAYSNCIMTTPRKVLEWKLLKVMEKKLLQEEILLDRNVFTFLQVKVLFYYD